MKSIFPASSAIALLAAPAVHAQCQRWLPVDSTYQFDNQVFALTKWDPDGAGPQKELLIAGGGFINAGAVRANRIAAWDGVRWMALGNGVSQSDTIGDVVYALAVHHGELYAGGVFPGGNIARWTGATWEPLGGGSDGLSVNGLSSYGGDLFATGHFHSIGGTPAEAIARWDGTVWHPLDSGLNRSGECLEEFKGALFVGGYFARAGTQTVHHIAAWDGSAWSSPGDGVTASAFWPYVSEMANYDGKLAVAGKFQFAETQQMNNVALWDGAHWSPMGAGLLDRTGARGCYAAVVYGDLLAVGGNFETSDGITRIAVWDGAAWSALGNGVNNSVNALAEFNGELIAGGAMMTAGGQSSPRWARWTSTGIPWIAVEPGDVARSCGEGAQFSVQAAFGYGGLEYSWRKDGQPLTDDGHISGSQTATLTISNLASDDGAVYACQVSNSCGGRLSRGASLVISSASDFDGDGYVTCVDFDLYVVAFEAGEITADFDSDGFLTGADFDLYVQAFELGC